MIYELPSMHVMYKRTSLTSSCYACGKRENIVLYEYTTQVPLAVTIYICRDCLGHVGSKV